MTKLNRWAFIVFLSFIPITLFAQSYHRLSASDFAGTPPADNGNIAYTNCYVGYNYDVIKHNGDYHIVFKIQFTLNASKSYIRFNEVKSREQLLQILRHEQGHYNIAYLLKCEAYSTLSNFRYSADYKREIVALFKRVQEKYHRMNDAYESETQNMQNIQNQDKWNTWFSNKIDNVAIAGAN